MKTGETRFNLKNFIRAARLPFLSASIFPFFAGSLLERSDFRFLPFILGFIVAGSTHISANLINDYADSRSGADWQDKRFYEFFGGSKLIQEGILKESSYLKLSILFFCVATLSVLFLAVVLNSLMVIGFFLLIVFLGLSYSYKPFYFSYNYLGEPVIFILFGPALVMGGYFIQTGIFPDFKSFLLSLPFGFFTAAILFANEVPDYIQDQKVKKLTWVGAVGPKKSFLVYYLLVFLGFLSILFNIVFGNLGLLAAVCLVFAAFSQKAAGILRNYYGQKEKLVQSSKLTIAVHSLVSVVIILSIFI